MLSSRALDEVALALHDAGADVEHGPDGEPTGRLWRLDAQLRAALPPAEAEPDLVQLAEELRGYGLTRLTDATPDLDGWSLERLRGFGILTLLLGDPQGASRGSCCATTICRRTTSCGRWWLPGDPAPWPFTA